MSEYPPIVARQQLGKDVPAARIVGGVVFYAIRVVSKEIRRLLLPRTSCLSFLAYLPYFEKIKVGLCEHLAAVCVAVPLCIPHINL
jgi:hypothetical protein